MLWMARMLGLLLASVQLKEVIGQSVPVLPALGARLADEDLQKGTLAGTFYVRTPRLVSGTPEISSFPVYWGADETTKLDSQPLVSIPVSATFPTCSGTSCSSITIQSVSPTRFEISRGMSGYDNRESATVTFPSAGTVTVTEMDIESGWDFLYIARESFTGTLSSYGEIVREVAAGQELLWSTDSSVVRNGWIVTFQTTAADLLSTNIGATAIPQGASHFLVYSANSNGEMASPFPVPIHDMFALPAPSALSFSDSNDLAYQVDGLLQLTGPSDTSDVLRYDVYWGGASGRLGVCSATVGFRFEPGMQLTQDCSGETHLQPIAADLVPGPTQVGGKGLRLDGSFAATATAATTSLQQLVSWTAAAWVNPSVQSTRLVSLFGSPYTHYEYYFAIQLTEASVPRCVTFPDLYGFGGQNFCEAPATHALSRNVWTHVTCVYEAQASLSVKLLRIYVNGALVQTCNAPEPSFSSMVHQLFIGGDPVPVESGDQSYFDGALDEVGLWNESLTPEAVSDLYMSYRVATWSVGETTSRQISARAPQGSSTLHAVAVGEFVESTPLVIPLVDSARPVHLPEGISFTDTDPAAGSYGGQVLVTRALNESDISRYVAYWGSSSTTKLSNTAALGYVDVAGHVSSQLSISVSAGSVPPAGASHIVVVSSINVPPASGESSQGVGLAYQDYVPPSVLAQAVSFSDTNPVLGKVSGTVQVTRASDESGVVSYNLYFADTNAAPLTLINKVPTSSSHITLTLTDVEIPSNATSILVLLEGAGGEAQTGVSTSSLDYAALDMPQGIAFEDIDSLSGSFQGTITIQRALSEADVTAYEIYWASGNGAGVAPTQLDLVESLSLGSLTVTMVFEMYDSYGDGWNSAEYTIKQGGVTLGTGTFQTGHFAAHTLTNIPVSTELTITVTEGNWPSEISWALKDEAGTVVLSSDGQTFPVDLPFTVTGSSGGGVFETSLPPTTPPSGADHLLTFARLTSGSASAASWVVLVDFAPPAQPPSSVAFDDTNGAAGVIAGVVTIGRAADESQISDYRIYFGTSALAKLGQVLASVSTSTSGSPLGVNLAATTLPSNASHLLAFSSSAGGENLQPAAVSISDVIIPTSAPSGVTFTDTDPMAGHFAGVVSFTVAPNQSAITHYDLYWGSSSSVPDFSLGSLGSVQAWSHVLMSSIVLNSSALPAGMTHLVVVSANGGSSMQTGAGVLLTDYVTVSVVPSSISFNDTDPSLNQISGTVTIGAASDESGVVDYAVYWGVSSTLRMPGGAPGLSAEFFSISTCPCSSCFPDFSTLGTPFLTQVENTSAYTAARPGGSFSIWPGLDRSELFAARWTGWFQIRNAGDYWFRVESDDRSRLYVAGVEIMGGYSYMTLMAGLHQIELQYFQCVGASYISAFISGQDTSWFESSLWAFARHGAQSQDPLATAPKAGAELSLVVAPSVIPAGVTHLLAFARAAGGVDSVYSISTELLDLVTPSVAAEGVNFTDNDPEPNMIQGVITIKRAQNEHDINFYKIYWGSSATEILDTTVRRLVTSSGTMQPSCTGVACGDIVIADGSQQNEWVVSRGEYGNHEQAFITLTGPAEVHFSFLSTETCCDKLYFPDHSPISGYNQLPDPITLPDGFHSVEWSSDYSVTSNGWSFTYQYTGALSSTPGLIALVPKPSGSQDISVLLERQSLLGSHFIVKSAYNSSESDASVAIQIEDLAPPDLGLGAVTFMDTDSAAGYIGGDLVIGEGSSGVVGFNIYWGRDSNNQILPGSAGLSGEYFYLSSAPSGAMPDFASLSPDVVQIETQLNQPETTTAWPGLTSSENFAARWRGYINITTAGSYIFTLSSDDGSQLFINGAMLVDNSGTHFWQSRSGDLFLLSGLHSLEVLFFNGAGSYGIVLEYGGPDTSNQQVVVPARVLRYGSLNNAFIGQVAAAASGNTVYQIQNLAVPEEASHLLVKAYSAEGEGFNVSSTEISDAFAPTVTASGIYFTDEDPTSGQIAGSILVQPAADQSNVSHYVIYWGSSATSKLSLLGRVSAGSGSGGSTSCGAKGPDTTPFRFSRNGVNGPKIVNGQAASECEWRWQISLRWGGISGHHFCGASLLSPKWAMTAAHCIDGSSFTVVIGDHNKDSSEDQHEREHAVLRTIVNPNYTSSSFTHDFALIELEQEVEMGDCAASVCLPSEEVIVGQECFITGWGTLSSGGSSPSIVQEGMVLTLSNSECASRYANEDITQDMLCAQGTSSSGIVDACQGDSGGPLVCAGPDGRYVLHGATSWGYGCADAQYPGIYARISAVLPWVLEVAGLTPSGGSSDGNLTFNISSQSIPATATHFLVFTSMNGLEMTSGISVPLVDFAPIQATPASIAFTDTDASPGELGGLITLGRASDEAEVTGYAVYWGSGVGSSTTTYYGLVGEVPKGSGAVEILVAPNTVKPVGATHFLGFTTASDGRGANYVAVQITDVDELLVPGGLSFQDTDAIAMQIGGTVTIQRAASSSGVSAYNLYLSSGACTAVGSAIANIPVSPGGGPTCFEGSSCAMITILQETAGQWVISRGMDGYENHEHAIIQVEGPGLVHFTRFETERSYDILRVGSASFSGTTVPADVELGAGRQEIEWVSDFSVTMRGWALSFQSYSTFGDISYSLPSTAFDGTVNSMIVFSVANGAEYTASCAATAVADFAPPNQSPQNLWFEDTNPSSGRVAGTVTILQARSHSGVSEYRVYWGQNSSTILPGSSVVLVVPATTAGTNLTVSLNETVLPTNATHLLAYSASSQGESVSGVSAEVIDYHPAQEGPQGLNFTDEDESAGYVSGTAYGIRAQDESTIEEYKLYFSSGQTKISFIGSAPSTSILPRPTCSGITCSHITINEVAGAFQVSRGSYDNEEFANMAITGPGRLRFTLFITEENYDFLTVMGTPYSGSGQPSGPPEEIYIPEGTHEITWRSDYSVTMSGWVFLYESASTSSLNIPVPRSAIPAGATDLLIVSSSSGGEMAQGATTPLVDYNPPQVVPESVECVDSDNSIGYLQGTCTVERASDESNVIAYEVFFGNVTGAPWVALGSLGRLAVTGLTGTSAVVTIPRVAVRPGASHLVAVAVGAGGIAARGASTALVDNIGLTLSPQSLDELGTPNSLHNVSIQLSNAASAATTLSIELIMEDASAESGDASTNSGTSGASSLSSSSLPAACLDASHAGSSSKHRLIYKMKGVTKGSGTARRLREAHARKLESTHGAKVKNLHIGQLSFAETKNRSVQSYCRLYAELRNDPMVEFVEEDQQWFPLGRAQTYFDLFLPGGKAPKSELRRGHMHRRGQCRSCGSKTARASHPNDPEYDDMWGLHQSNDNDIDAPEAWSIHKGLSGRVIVAVLDTGVDYNHEDLRNQMWRNPGEIPGDGIDNDGNGFVDDVYGYDFYEDDGDPMDGNGHGTHCAGTIGAEGGNSIGVVGVTWKPQIMALRFLGPNGGSTIDAIRALDYAVQMGAHITSNSWGGGGFSVGLETAINEAAAANQLFIVAAGNDGQDNDVVSTYPCNYNLPNMICVASTDRSNDMSSFSNWGVNNVHIAAPGSSILSTYTNGEYVSLSGTSMATPHVSGVAALVLDYVHNMPFTELRNVILNSAVPYAKFASKVSTGALLNAHAALAMAGEFAWIRMFGSAISAGTVTIPAQGSTTVVLQLGGSGLDYGEYRARLRIWGVFNEVLYSREVPILYTLHNFTGLPAFGATDLQFADVDGRRGMISGALTITRATPEQEATFSQYHVFWAGSSQNRLFDVPLAALDTGNVLRDDFAIFDSTFWSLPHGSDPSSWITNVSVSNGAAVFSNQYSHAHLTLARRFAPPFTVKTKVKKSSGALAHMVVQIGGTDVNLFGSGGIRAVFLGTQKVLISPEGVYAAAPCTLGTWFEVTITVRATSVTFADNQGCPEIVQAISSSESTKSIRIGADCTGDCATNGGSVWEYFEVSGGLYATFHVPENTLIPSDATGFVIHGWNSLGLNPSGYYEAFADHRVANRATSPSEVLGSAPSTGTLTVSWTRGALNDCTGLFMRYEVVAQMVDQSDSQQSWFEPSGCQGLVSQTSESCLASGLSSGTPYQFKVRVLCSLEETQSLWSEISPAVVTLPSPAAAPTEVRARIPGSSTLLVSWLSGVLNDCEFVESGVEAQEVGQSVWFAPQGCTGLSLNAYHCQAESLNADTQYIFRVQSRCTDPLASSPYSVSSVPESTLATLQSWEVSQRRVLSINMISPVSYNDVMTSAELKNAVISRIVSHTAEGLNVQASRVKVEIMAGQASGTSRRLTTGAATVFAVTVEGATQSDNETSNHVILGVSSALQAEAGITATLALTSTSSLTPATAPEKIAWQELGDNRLQLNWNVLPLGDCNFLAWHVLAHIGSTAVPVAGCTQLLNLSKPECVAFGMDETDSHRFTVDVMCGNPAANSDLSEESDVWPSAPVAVLGGTLTAKPSVARPCDQVVLLLFATGAAEPIQKQWTLSSGSQSFSSILQSVLEGATAASASTLTLSSKLLQDLLAANSGESLVLDFIVQLTSSSGDSTQVTSSLTIDAGTEDLTPSIMASGPTEVSQNFEEELRLEVVTSLTSSCASSDTSQIRLKTTWRYQASEASDSSAWQTLEDAGLVDASPLPNTLRLSAYGLVPGSHQFRAMVEVDGSASQSSSITYTVLVTDPLPELEIIGPRSVGAGCGIELSCAVAGSLHPEATLSYKWICLFPADCNSTIGPELEGKRLVVDSSQAVLGSYKFGVTVTRQIPNLPSVSSYAEAIVVVAEGGPLPVEISSPWSRLEALSQQATSLVSPVLARVGTTNSECQVPSSAVFQWVLATDGVTNRIVASLNAESSRPSAGIVLVTTSSFDGSALEPSMTYVYALLRADSFSLLLQGAESDSLQDAAALGLSISMSLPFVVDAAPTPGVVVAIPQEGEALKTQFTFSTSGWTDEDTDSLQFAYYVFPVDTSYTVSMGEDGHLKSSPAFQPPQINFDDPSSNEFWTKKQGLTVRLFASSPSVSGRRLSNNAFFTVVRAKDRLGGVAQTTMLGPLVQTPTNLSQADLVNALAESQTSNDPAQILTSIQVVMSMSSEDATSTSSSVASVALDALAQVTTMVEATDDTLQQLGGAVAQVVEGGNLDTESLIKAADVVGDSLTLALTSGKGLSAAAGSSLLGGIAAIGKTSTSEDTTEVKSVSTKLVSLVADLGTAAITSLADGAKQEINSVDESGQGIKVAVAKPSPSEAAVDGFKLNTLSIPGDAVAGRRLDGCESLAVQATEWLKTNPYNYRTDIAGATATIATNADVVSVKIDFCSRLELLQATTVSIPLPEASAGADRVVPKCARFDHDIDGWTIFEVSTELDIDAGLVKCSSTKTLVAYTVFLDNEGDEGDGDTATTADVETSSTLTLPQSNTAKVVSLMFGLWIPLLL